MTTPAASSSARAGLNGATTLAAAPSWPSSCPCGRQRRPSRGTGGRGLSQAPSDDLAGLPAVKVEAADFELFREADAGHLLDCRGRHLPRLDELNHQLLGRRPGYLLHDEVDKVQLVDDIDARLVVLLVLVLLGRVPHRDVIIAEGSDRATEVVDREGSLDVALATTSLLHVNMCFGREGR